MRILYHHRTLGDGAEGIHVSAIVEAFQHLGHEVKVAALIGKETNVSNARTRALGRLRSRIPRLGYEVMELGYSLVGYRMLMARLRAWKADLLYERHALFNMAGLAAARRAGIPFVLEVNAPLAHERASYEHLALKRTARRVERLVCSRADRVVAVSSPLRDYLVQEGAIGHRITVVPNGVDPDLFQPDARARAEVRAHVGIADDCVVIGFAGILRPWHGIQLLFEAVARMPATRHRVHVLLVGDGPSRASLEHLARSLGLQSVVTFTGRVAHHDVPRYLAAFDIGVSPRAPFYASPMKVLEYMAAGVAVIAPRTANLEDVITDSVDGVLFRPEDPDDLSERLTVLAADADRRRQLGRSARAAVLAGRTWQHNAARVLALIGNGQS